MTIKENPYYKRSFALLASALSLSLFLKAGFISAGLISISIYTLLSLNFSLDRFNKSWILLMPVIFFLSYFVGIIHSNDLGKALDIIERLIPLLLFPMCFLLSTIRISEKEFYIILTTFLIGCIICSFICYFYALQNIIYYKEFSIETIDRKVYFFSNASLTDPVGIHPIYLSMYCNFAFIIALSSPLLKDKGVRITTCIFIAIFIILLSSKIGIICFLILIMFWLIYGNKKLHSYLFITIIISTSVYSIYKFPFLKERFITSTKFDYTEKYGHLWNSTTYRLAIWECSAESIAKKPWTGYGTSNGQMALRDVYKKKGFELALNADFNSHNQFLSTQLDLGIIGTIILLGLLSWPLILAIKSGNKILICFTIIIILFCLGESIFLRQKGVVFFSFFYCLIIWYFKKNNYAHGHI